MRKFISALLLVGALSFVGCEKKEEESAVDKLKGAAEEVKKEGKKIADEVKKEAEK